jgi:hypothetical protein
MLASVKKSIFHAEITFFHAGITFFDAGKKNSFAGGCSVKKVISA